MVKSPKIMGMNKQKVLQNLHTLFYIKIGLFQTDRTCEAWMSVLGWLGNLEGLWTQIFQVKGRNTLKVDLSLQLHISNLMRSNSSVKAKQ